jgi:VWFA-related protein
MTGSISRRAFLDFAAALAAAPWLDALPQSPGAQSEATFSTDVNVVNVFVTAHDKQGKIITDLAKEDFALSEDGRAQTIKYFSRENNLPLTLGLLVDTSMSQRRVLGEEKSASYKFLDRVLRQQDQAFVIHFDHDTELLQDLTNSKPKLQKSLDDLQLPDESRPQLNRGGTGYPGGNGSPRYPGPGRRMRGPGTTLYDAIFLASDELMRRQKGRKALVLLTDGVDNGSKTPLNEAIASAQRADTLVYSILFADEEAYGNPMGGFGGRGMGRRGGGMGRFPQNERHDGKKVLQQLSRETGGGFYEVSKKLTVEDIYDRIQDDLRNQYSLGYSSDKRDASGEYRAISVTTTRKGALVQAREGYYPTAH